MMGNPPTGNERASAADYASRALGEAARGVAKVGIQRDPYRVAAVLRERAQLVRDAIAAQRRALESGPRIVLRDPCDDTLRNNIERLERVLAELRDAVDARLEELATAGEIQGPCSRCSPAAKRDFHAEAKRALEAERDAYARAGLTERAQAAAAALAAMEQQNAKD